MNRHKKRQLAELGTTLLMKQGVGKEELDMDLNREERRTLKRVRGKSAPKDRKGRRI